ncbi:MAG: hypothetical protein LBQ16_06730, partial [Gracilibacteraceae bacterium]|nr:hypothetical protein [Gracilibacteraceae bacterium]
MSSSLSEAGWTSPPRKDGNKREKGPRHQQSKIISPCFTILRVLSVRRILPTRYYFTVLLEQIAPYWAFGIVLGSAVSVFGKEKIHGLLSAMQGKRFGAFGVIPASLL